MMATTDRSLARGELVPATAPELHTMYDRLADYVLPKIPVAELCACEGRALVTGNGRLDTLVDPHKIGTKRFNWRRPAFRRVDDTLVCDALPGVDYTWHYARLIASAAAMLGFPPAVQVVRPNPDEAGAFVDATMPATLALPDVVVVGYVERLFPGQGSWHIDGGFGWRCGRIAGEQVAFVGCEFSYWGDLAGAVVTALVARGARWVIYVGKLGTLQPGREPNRWVATGTSSLVAGQLVYWPSCLAAVAGEDFRVLVDQRHITVASIVDETLAWYDAAVGGRYHLVDPEIGHMAAAANSAGIVYDYLHIVSDNLTGHYTAGLYHERSADVRTARLRCLEVIERTLERGLA